jgi:peptidyl-prolyl cis-trans isomerase C
MKRLVLPAIFAVGLSAQIPQIGAPSAAQASLPPNTVVATVGGIGVTIEDVRKMLETAPPQVAGYIRQSPQAFIQQMFLLRYLSSQGDQLKLGEESPFKEELEAQRNWVIANAMVTYERNHYQVSEDQIQDFYQKNQSRWQQAKVKEIFIGFQPAAPASSNPQDLAEAAKRALEAAHPANSRSEDEAKKLAADIVSQLRSGADFGKLVEQYSDDPSSKASGGEVPPIKATSSLPDDLKKAIFALSPGGVGDPIRQPTGFYIIRMEEKSVQPVNDVREPIIQEFRDKHRNDWLNGLNSRFVPVVQKPEFFVSPQTYLPELAPAGAQGKK